MMPSVVEVHWIDAHVSTDEVNVSKATKDTGVLTVTTGFLVTETDHGLTIAMDWWPKHPKKFRVPTFLPWEMVKEYYVYK